jgi:pimeloyl-ACP methyl ester carboxylesterase
MLRQFGSGRFFGTSFGAGDPWVCALHGWRRDHGDFRGVLGDGIDGIALDLPGFGATPPPPEGWGSPEYAREVVPVLEEMPAPTVVLGHSFGGRVALHLAAARPDLVRALVLCGVPRLLCTGGGRRPPLAFRAGRRLHRMGLVGDRAMDRLRMRYGSPDYRLAEGVMRQVCVRVLAECYEEQLKALGCPVELVWGLDDTAAPVAEAERASELLREGRLSELPGVGHLVPTEAPGALRSALEKHRP